MKKLIITLCFILTVCNLQAENMNDEEVYSVSMIQLIATPEKYHGKWVKLIGVPCIDFEADSIWLSLEHFKNKVYGNSIHLKIENVKINEYKKYNGKYVILTGKFNKGKKGHMGMHKGSISCIKRYDLWSK